MSFPSMRRPSGSAAPASRANVGNTSRVVATSSELVPAGTLPGQRTTHGTRMPPSAVV